MRGELWVDSEEGKGSTFHFTLRFLRQDETQPIAAPARKNTLAPAIDGRQILAFHFVG